MSKRKLILFFLITCFLFFIIIFFFFLKKEKDKANQYNNRFTEEKPVHLKTDQEILDELKSFEKPDPAKDSSILDDESIEQGINSYEINQSGTNDEILDSLKKEEI